MVYDQIVATIEELIGVALMEDEVDRTLAPLLRARAGALGLRPEAYLRRLEGAPRDGREWSQVVAAVTNNQTCFFRDPDQFDTLGRLLERAARERPRRRVAIWCSACSSGEEPYSIAMLCAELGVAAHIVGSDVDAGSLERARAGRYRPWTLRNVSRTRLARWFSEEPGGHRVVPAICEAVHLVPHNLVRDAPLPSCHPDGLWDIVLCRNVLIYFRRERVAGVCEALLGSLAPGGAFVVAASETLHGLAVAARPELVENRIVYRQATPPTAGPAAGAAGPKRLVPRRARTVLGPATAPVPRRPASGPGAADELPALLDRVARLAVDGRLGAAREALAPAASVAEPSVEVLLSSGHIDLCGHDFGGALESYARAGERDFLLCEVHYFLALVHRKRGEWQAAADALRRALFLAPSFWHASYLLAGTYARLGRSGDAARERARTRRLLSGPPPIVTFISHPLFVERFGITAVEVRRHSAMWPAG